ncbi:MAG: MarR family transcriptional regulator [Archangium sp.]|nr:MarR family transcriptional regulator [Archangium sp.]
MNFPTPTLDQHLCFALYRASRAVIRSYGPLLKPLGLTYPQYLVMLTLWESDDVQVKQLGARLELDSATLTPLLKRLEAQGLISRQRDDRDERSVRVTLTTKGTALKAKTKKVPAELACLWGFDPKDAGAGPRLLALRDQLNRLTQSIEASNAEP